MKKGRRVQTTGKVYKNTFLDAVVVAYGYGYSSSNEENSSSLKKIRKDIDKGEYFVLSQRKNTSSSMINYYMSPNSSVEFYDEIKEYIVAGAFIIESYRQEHFPSSEAEWEGNGSGFFIDKRGYIATNHHVIQGASEIQVSFGRNQNEIQTYKADVVHSNKGIDVAIIKIDDARFKPFGYIPYNISSGVSPVGTAAYAMGYPLHMQLSEEIRYTEGYINALSGFRNDPNAYQMQVPIQPGNSGGPLFDKKGNLIGINSSGIDAYQNVNFAVKSTVLIDFISSSIKPKLVLPNDTKTLSKAKDMSEMVEIVKPYVVLIKVR
jgi:S1-C subfamily serine protease